MEWTQVNGTLTMARGIGYDYSIRKLAAGGYLVRQDSSTNGQQRETVATEAAAFALAERWNKQS